jgi:hypothetical protein
MIRGATGWVSCHMGKTKSNLASGLHCHITSTETTLTARRRTTAPLIYDTPASETRCIRLYGDSNGIVLGPTSRRKHHWKTWLRQSCSSQLSILHYRLFLIDLKLLEDAHTHVERCWESYLDPISPEWSSASRIPVSLVREISWFHSLPRSYMSVYSRRAFPLRCASPQLLAGAEEATYL